MYGALSTKSMEAAAPSRREVSVQCRGGGHGPDAAVAYDGQQRREDWARAPGRRVWDVSSTDCRGSQNGGFRDTDSHVETRLVAVL